ncbi:MAG: NMD3-related protein [Candidatus Woesearchaeota archaeon]
MKKCIICGKEISFGAFCKDCYVKENPVIKKVKTLNIKICENCNDIEIKNKWNILEEGIEKLIKESVVFDENFEIYETLLLDYYLEEKKIKIILELNGIIKELNEEFSEQIELEYPYQPTLCEKCKKSNTQYYEAILQLRDFPINFLNEVQNFLKEEMMKNKVYSNKEIIYKKSKKQKNSEEILINKDIYLTSMNFAKAFVRELEKKYKNLETKISRKIYSKDKVTSKDLYRLTILVRYNN